MACYSKGCTEEVDKSRLQWLRKAHDYALEAHNMDDKDTDVLSVLCSATGKLAEDSGTYEKIKLGFEFQTYLDKAIALCADSYEFLHMRGRLAFQAEKTSPNEIENVFFIGKTYDALGDYANAKIYLEKVLTLPTDPECLVEQEYVDEAKEILNGSNYSN
ncbi:hypothetical protein ANCDUO_15700 [Ancylostoma duodenale]|uniref:Tetratricopeptide repeat protein n=1 Tax=Ancylostoma duodenale TaxID=51022 RepID=A0A0C2G5H7_9BILA|nr:hypothetical protein ANCDUO_15700 [Ancylostoma duodenale]